jgi:hypothetical protein
MSDDCKKTQTYYRYTKVRGITTLGVLEKQPRLAPAPSKTPAQMLQELNARLDADITARNAITPPQCGWHCDYLGERLASDTTDPRTVKIIWTEPFELRDADGNVIRGTARYRTRGDARVQTEKYERECDSKFGEPDDAWKEAAFNPDHTNVETLATAALDDVWAALPKAERDMLEFLKAGESGAKKT